MIWKVILKWRVLRKKNEDSQVKNGSFNFSYVDVVLLREE